MERFAECMGHGVTDPAQGLVADIMRIGVVNALEMVDVEQAEAERPAVRYRRGELALQDSNRQLRAMVEEKCAVPPDTLQRALSAMR